MRLSIIVGMFALVGCPGGGEDSDSGGGGSDDGLSFSESFTDEALTLSISGGSGTYIFGMAELSDGGWFGEDGLAGLPHDENYGGQSGDYDINHDAMTDGKSLSIVEDLDLVDANSTTLVSATVSNGDVAFFLTDEATCWTMGDTDGYYNEFFDESCG